VTVGRWPGDPPELGLQVGVLAGDGGPGSFGERVGEPDVTGVGAARASLVASSMWPGTAMPRMQGSDGKGS
jgi:hypothetical protein